MNQLILVAPKLWISRDGRPDGRTGEREKCAMSIDNSSNRRHLSEINGAKSVKTSLTQVAEEDVPACATILVFSEQTLENAKSTQGFPIEPYRALLQFLSEGWKAV